MTRIGKVTYVERDGKIAAMVNVGVVGVFSGESASSKKAALASLVSFMARQLSDAVKESADFQLDIARLDAKLVEVQEAHRVAVASAGSWERAASQLQTRRDVEIGKLQRLERSPGAMPTGDGAMDQLIRERDGLEGEVVRLENEVRALRMLVDNPDEVQRLKEELERTQKIARRRSETITSMLKRRTEFHRKYRAAKVIL